MIATSDTESFRQQHWAPRTKTHIGTDCNVPQLSAFWLDWRAGLQRTARLPGSMSLSTAHAATAWRADRPVYRTPCRRRFAPPTYRLQDWRAVALAGSWEGWNQRRVVASVRAADSWQDASEM